jgi:membrane fusion protein, heavy metal efflux system
MSEEASMLGWLVTKRRLLGALPSIFVLGILAGVAYVGHENNWQWSATEEKNSGAAKDKDDDDRSLPDDDANFGSSAFDPTLAIRHDPDHCRYLKKPIQFKDADVVRKSGIVTAAVDMHLLKPVLNATASVDFDSTLVARVSPRAGGTVWRMSKRVGDPVRPDDILAIVDSAEVGRLKSAFFQAKVQLDLKRQLRERLQQGVTPESTILVADAAVREARAQLQNSYQALLNLGMRFSLADAEKLNDDKLLSRLQFLGLDKENLSDALETTNNLLAVANPLRQGGVVLSRDGVIGEAVAAGQPLFVVGDPSRMTVLVDVRQEDARQVEKGMLVRFYPDGDKASASGERPKPVECRIDWVAPEVDPKTRIVKARAAVDNQDGRLRARAFGNAEIVLRAEGSFVAVPDEAIQWEGCSHIVFVRTSPTQFEVRRVKLGVRDGGYVQVVEGVKQGETIAVLGSHVLKSVLFRDLLGSAEE